MDKTLSQIFQEGEQIIENIRTGWITLWLHRELIQRKTELIMAIYDLKKKLVDKSLEVKNKELGIVEQLMQMWEKKTPAQDKAKDETRADRYELDKVEIDLEKFLELIKNWTYHIRIGEIDLNKVWVDFNQ